MAGVCLASLLTLVLAIPPDAAALVARLGSGTPAERAEAADRLEAMGRDALPALEAALRPAVDEVRARLLAVWERTQRRLMVRPTMVRLDGGGRPLTEILKSLGEQTGFQFDFSPQRPEPRVDAREPAPIPFWEAIDRLGAGPGYLHQVLPSVRSFPVLSFGPGVAEYPKTISGPFRITVQGVHDHRDRLLISGPWIGMNDLNPGLIISRTAPGREARFHLDLGMQIEPRMWFNQEGPARAIEAIDDRGRSMVRRESTRVEADVSLFRSGDGVSEGHFELDLAMPESPARSIARLMGSVPVAVLVRRPVPDLDVPLPAPVGSTFTHEDAIFTLQEYREDAAAIAIGLDIRIDLHRFELPPGSGLPLASSRVRCLTDHQIEVVDADGRLLSGFGGGSASPDGHARRNYRIPKPGGKPLALRFRYYRIVRAFTDVTFEFRDIPLP